MRAIADSTHLLRAPPRIAVVVHVVDETRGSQYVASHEVPMDGQQPVLLHGGGLLGVVLNKPVSPAGGACAGWWVVGSAVGELRARRLPPRVTPVLLCCPTSPHAAPCHAGRAMRFISWNGFAALGPEVPEPQWVAWEPECTLLALGYPHTVELCRTRPAFERFATVAIAEAVSGIWQSRQLFVATPSSLHVVFADPVQQFVQEVQVRRPDGRLCTLLGKL